MSTAGRDWLKWVAAGFALAATASAEYELARAIGMHKIIAVAVPGALDAYVVRALRAHREVLTAVLAMIAANAASHLVTAGIVLVDWRLITAVSAVAPLVLWRVHALSTPGEARQRVLWGVRKGARAPEHVPSTPPQTCSHGCEVWGDLGAHERAHDLAGWSTPTPPVHAPSTLDEHAEEALSVAMPDYVPTSWSTPEHGQAESCVACSGSVTYDDEHGWVHSDVRAPCSLREGTGTAEIESLDSLRARVLGPEHADKSTRARHLKTVPPLPDGYVTVPPSHAHAGLAESDRIYLERARVLDAQAREHDGEGVTVRRLKTVLAVGTPRAQRLRDHLRAEHASSTPSTEEET